MTPPVDSWPRAPLMHPQMGHAALAWRKGCQEAAEPVNAGRAACTQRCPQATGAVSSFDRARSLTASMLGQRSTRLTFCFGSSARPHLHCMRTREQLCFPGGDGA